MTFDKNTIDEIINCFTQVYGERHREIISEKINNCLILLCGYKEKEELIKLYNDLNKKYYDKLYQEVLKFVQLSESDFRYLFGTDIFKEDGLIASFGSISQNIVDKFPKTRANEFNTKQILNARDSFYAQSEIKDISVVLADQLMKIYDRIIEEVKSEYQNNALNFKQNMYMINQIGFLEKTNFDIEFYDFEEQQHNGVQPNFIKDENGDVKLYPIITFSTVKRKIEQIFGAQDYFDVLLIHEINHIIGMHLKEYRDYGDFVIQIGILISDTGKNTTKYYKTSMIDEIFNQKVAKKITNLLHKKGIYLVDNPKKSKTDETALYEMAEFLLDDFFLNFEDELLEIYVSGSGLDEFYEKLGLENLNALGILIEDYLSNPDILDVSEEENKVYKQKAKKIVDDINSRISDVGQDALISDLASALSLLDINELENIDEVLVLSAYKNMLLKFGVDNNANSECFSQIRQSITNGYNLIIENLDVIKSSNSIMTNKRNAKLYNTKKKVIFGSHNEMAKRFTNEFVDSLFANDVAPEKIITLSNLLEYQLFTASGAKVVENVFGNDFYDILINVVDSETVTSDMYQELLSIMEKLSKRDNQGIKKN